MTKAVILAAGRGARMEGLTADLPKPMLPAGGRPILERLLDRLEEAGFSQALIVTGYRAETIEDYFRGYRLPLQFVRQTELTGTATAALLARAFVGAAVYAGADRRVTRIVEKPPRGQSATRWNSAGIYAFRPSIFDELQRTAKSPRGEYELTSAVAQLLDNGKRLEIFPIEGQWRDIGRPEDLEAVRDLR